MICSKLMSVLITISVELLFDFVAFFIRFTFFLELLLDLALLGFSNENYRVWLPAVGSFDLSFLSCRELPGRAFLLLAMLHLETLVERPSHPNTFLTDTHGLG